MLTEGINLIATNKNQEELIETDKKISSSVKSLGLSMKTSSDKK